MEATLHKSVIVACYFAENDDKRNSKEIWISCTTF